MVNRIPCLPLILFLVKSLTLKKMMSAYPAIRHHVKHLEYQSVICHVEYEYKVTHQHRSQGQEEVKFLFDDFCKTNIKVCLRAKVKVPSLILLVAEVHLCSLSSYLAISCIPPASSPTVSRCVCLSCGAQLGQPIIFAFKI